MIDPAFLVAAVQIGGYPIPAVGVVDPAAPNIGITSIFISESVALHVTPAEVFITDKPVSWYVEEHGNHELSRAIEEASADLGDVSDYERLAVTFYCFAHKTQGRGELAVATRVVVRAHRDLVSQVSEINKKRAN